MDKIRAYRLKLYFEHSWQELRQRNFRQGRYWIEQILKDINDDCKLEEINDNPERSVKEILKDHGECENCG